MLKANSISDYSIIIPAYNEAELLPATLNALKQAMAAMPEMHGEIIVVDNNSSDNTAELAVAGGAKVVTEPINQISRARNCGANAAAGRFFLFLDADTILSGELLQQALHNLQNEKCCGGGVLVDLADDNIAFAIKSCIKCWNWLAVRCKLAAGCFIYCRRDAFVAVGGFSDKLYAGEELKLSRQLVAWGRQHNQSFLIIEKPHIMTSARKDEWHSSLKLIAIMLFLMIFPPALRFRWCCSIWYKRPSIK
ncbi:MAG: glycosyltransferase [Victivallaceae bacterium]|nr:glycosyltransferase [Victivallaceae bacterium]